MGIEDYQPQVLALLLLIQMSSPTLFREITARPESLFNVKKLEAQPYEEIQKSFVDYQEPLHKALKLVEVPEGIDLEAYIYLSRVVRLETEEVLKAKSMRKLISNELEIILKRHQEWLLSQSSGERADLSYVDLHDRDMSNIDLCGALMIGTDLNKTSLFRSNLSKSDLTGANLLMAILSQANLSRTNLRMASMFGAHLTKAYLCNANLEGSDLRRADLMEADLKEANLNEAKLSEANLMGANLQGAKVDIEELGKAITDEDTILPDGSRGPVKKEKKENK